MLSDLLINLEASDRKKGLLDHKWLIRQYLATNKKLFDDDLTNDSKKSIKLLESALSPFTYIKEHKSQIENDISLKALVQLCSAPHLLRNVHHIDNQLYYLANLFNQLVDSDRILIMCYDCGTVARGVFFMLIKAYRGDFTLKKNEIQRIKNEYYMDKYEPQQSLEIFSKSISSIKKNCLYLCALQFGEKFGHIYIIEKIYINNKPRYRIYQSSHQSYMLIDYIEHMDYAAHINTGIDINQHLQDLSTIVLAGKWNATHITTFNKWFHFYPTDRILKSDIKRFASTCIIY